VHYFAFERND
jgi:hypothetical protein